MGKYVLNRLVHVVPVFLGATFIIWAMVFVMAGDPIRALSGFKPQPPEVNFALRQRYHLDDPLLVQYVKYLANLLSFDFGSDFRGREVSDLIRERLPNTLRLTLIAVVFEVVIGISAGVLAAVRHRRFVDSLVLMTTVSAISVPIVVVAPAAQAYLSVEMGWFPRGGTFDGWYSFLLPGLILGSLSLAAMARLLRASLVENLRQGYVLTATAKGLRHSRVVGVHALRNSLLPVVTFFGADLGVLLSGTAVVETVFNIPGIGLLLINGARAQETPVVVGVTSFLVIVYVVVNLLVDLLYGVLDPRVRTIR